MTYVIVLVYLRLTFIFRQIFCVNELKNILKLLRFPFSIFLLPVSLFSFFYIQPTFTGQLVLLLFIWHCLVFPASNGYNSYNDEDEGPIGALALPPKPTRNLLFTVNAMDLTAIVLACLISFTFALFVIVYIVASRLYSSRKIRLKKYPVLGFLVVFIFQGAWVFYANIFALTNGDLVTNSSVILSAVASSFLIGTVYPITQIYQHKADAKDGVKTLSMLLGIRGTFVFTASMFGISVGLIYLAFSQHLSYFWLFNLVMLPSTLFFLFWAFRSFGDELHANFKNAMIMLVLSSMLTNIYFILVLVV